MIILATVGAASAIYYFLKPSAPNVSLEFTKPDKIFVGKPFTLGVSLSNSSDQVLKDAKFSVFLPAELTFLDHPDQRVYEESLGDIGPGSVTPKTINLIATAGAQSFKQVQAKLSYSLTTSPDVQFQSQGTADVGLGEPAVAVSIVTPQSVNSGENFDVKVKLQNNTSEDIKNLDLKLSYPPSFNFVKADLDGAINNQEWTIPVLQANQSQALTVSGNLVGADLSRFQFVGAVSAQYSGTSYTIDSENSEMALSPSPLSVRLVLNNSDVNSYLANAGDNLNYEIFYKNNSQTSLANLKLSAGLVGDMFDFTTLSTDGIFNSITNVLSWNQQNAQDMAVLGPGEERSVRFNIRLKNAFPIRRLGDKNFTLKVNLNMESPTVPEGVAAQKTVTIVSGETKLIGRADVKALGYFYDAASGILNKGPYPPRANQKTQYTIHWQVLNYSTDISGVKLSANVAPGVNFTGKVKSNADSQPVYNSATGVISWDLGNVPATKGVISAPFEAVFQIEYTPSNLQIGSDVPLLQDTQLTAQDTFTGHAISASAPTVTTALPDDNKISGTDRRVRP